MINDFYENFFIPDSILNPPFFQIGWERNSNLVITIFKKIWKTIQIAVNI